LRQVFSHASAGAPVPEQVAGVAPVFSPVINVTSSLTRVYHYPNPLVARRQSPSGKLRISPGSLQPSSYRSFTLYSRDTQGRSGQRQKTS